MTRSIAHLSLMRGGEFVADRVERATAELVREGVLDESVAATLWLATKRANEELRRRAVGPYVGRLREGAGT